MNISPKLKAAATRATRTFAQAFLGLIIAKWVAGPTTITGLVDAVKDHADLAGGTGLFAALAALGLNFTRPVSPEKVI